MPKPPRSFSRCTLGSALLLLAACGGNGTETHSGPEAETPVLSPLHPGPYELAIHNVRLVDGSGAPAREQGVLVVGGRLVYVGPLDPDTLEVSEVVDGEGRILAPGFIDAHAHGDAQETPGFPSFLAQGVTSIFLGMDGSSPSAARFADTLEGVERVGPWLNVAWLAGHGTLRLEAGTGYGPASPEAREALVEGVARAMDAGAFGVSLGLEYDAGRGADEAELLAVGHVVAERGGIISSHMRNEDGDQVEASLAELIRQGEGSGARVHVSHLKVVLGTDRGVPSRLLAQMEEARGRGVEISADVYPYTASFTGISILFPDWARPPADYEAVKGARRSELLDSLRLRVEGRRGPEATLFGSGPWRGQTLAQAAAAEARPFEEILLDLGPSGARAAYFVMEDSVMRRFLLDPHTVVSTDGSPTMNHPRGYGSFPRVLRRFVLEESALSLEAAIHKMTGQTASLFGLDREKPYQLPRGLIRPGFAADLVLFHPEALRDPADFETPNQLAQGMHGVWVNGVRVVGPSGLPTETETGGPGRVLRSR